MTTREQILKNEVFWTETIQNKIYNDLASYIEEEKITQKELAKKLGLSKGRVSQILNGKNLNFRIDTLVKICLAIGKIPDFRLKDLETFIAKDLRSKNISTVYKQTSIDIIDLNESLTFTPSEEEGKLIPLKTRINSESPDNFNRLIPAM